MPGEKNLDILLQSMQPILHKEEYVFCTVQSINSIPVQEIILFFKEEEGQTVILQKELADKLGLKYQFVSAWITLAVHSSLEAIGLTAAFSTALAAELISCNVVAGYYHDHIFVASKDADKAMEILNRNLYS